MDAPISHEDTDFNVEAVLQMTSNENKELRTSQAGESWDQFNPEVMIETFKKNYIKLRLRLRERNIPPGKYTVVFF